MTAAPDPPRDAAIEPREAQKLQEAGRALIVDVREPTERDAARIPGSVHVPLQDLPQRAGELPTDRTLVLQCATGNRSEAATRFLLAGGHPDARNLLGGIVRWYHEGLPVDTGPETP